MKVPPIDKDLVSYTMVVAMSVRNAMEDFHSSPEGPTDAQMEKLNPLIRTGILTAVHAWRFVHIDPAYRYLRFQDDLIPDYWEPPQLLASYVESWDRYG